MLVLGEWHSKCYLSTHRKEVVHVQTHTQTHTQHAPSNGGELLLLLLCFTSSISSLSSDGASEYSQCRVSMRLPAGEGKRRGGEWREAESGVWWKEAEKGREVDRDGES